jgi:hypothetical protein
MSPALFAVVILEIGFAFYPGCHEPWTSYFKLLIINGMIGLCHNVPPIEKGVLQTFLPGLPQNHILLISASPVATITSKSH